MDKFGPITNTRTVEDAVREAMARLGAAPQTPRVVQLTGQARRYQELVASWELLPPVPEEQFQTIGEIMRLLAVCMAACDESAKNAEGAAEPSGAAGAREANDAFDIDELGPGTPPSTGVPVARIQFGREQNEALEELLHLETGPAPEVVRPQTRPWQVASNVAGVELKVVQVQDDGLRRHLLVRLQHGASLQAHTPTRSELIQIVDGAVQVSGHTVHAGCFVRFAAEKPCAKVTADGEAVLFLIDSERSFSGD